MSDFFKTALAAVGAAIAAAVGTAIGQLAHDAILDKYDPVEPERAKKNKRKRTRRSRP